MWIFKNSKNLLETLSSRSQYVCNSIKTFDFSTLYTTIPYAQQKSITKELVTLYGIKQKSITKELVTLYGIKK
jgi:hypothetical protein